MNSSLDVTATNQTTQFIGFKRITMYNTSDTDIYLRDNAEPTATVGEHFMIPAGKSAVYNSWGQTINYKHFGSGSKALQISVDSHSNQ